MHIHRPTGRACARYLLGSELHVEPVNASWRAYGLPDGKNIRELFWDLNVDIAKIKRDWPYCCILKTLQFTKLTPASQQLKIRFPGASRIIKDIQKRLPTAQGKFQEWILKNVRHDKNSLKLLKMILAGETCVPWAHLSSQYALDCLESAVKAKEA